MKNRKQRIVAVFILAVLIIAGCVLTSRTLAEPYDGCFTASFKSSVIGGILPMDENSDFIPIKGIYPLSKLSAAQKIEATTNSETKINYSDTIQVLVTPELKHNIEYLVSTYENEIVMATKVMVVEAGGVPAASHRAAVVWCILNRADAGYGSVSNVITSPNQFAWYSGTSYTQEQYELVKDVFTRWILEQNGCNDVGRVLPSDYLWFGGNGRENLFRNTSNPSGLIWDWSLPDPYI